MGELVMAAVADFLLIFRHLQDADSGDFVITGLTQVDWLTVGVVTACGAVVGGVLLCIAKRKQSNE